MDINYWTPTMCCVQGDDGDYQKGTLLAENSVRRSNRNRSRQPERSAKAQIEVSRSKESLCVVELRNRPTHV